MVGAYRPWRFNRLSEQQWHILVEFFKTRQGMTETEAAVEADKLGTYMDMVWEPER